jgi:DNA-directed RNA polymerase specialized sigma24 family protein
MESIEEIYKKYANLIKNYIFCITRDTMLAEEIMQETFVVAITRNRKIPWRL